MSDSNNSGGGIGCCGVLGISFIILKLCGVITWSWWWVLAPFWIPFAMVVVFLLIVGLVALLADKT